MWEIWKAYTSIIFGEGHWSRRLVIELIRRTIYEWTLHKGKKYILPDASLVQIGLIPSLATPRCRVIHWVLPPPGRHKLNVDAAHGKYSAEAGAILRDSTGAFTKAISFSLPISSPDQAELQATVLAVLYFACFGYHMDVEVDAQSVLTNVHEHRSTLVCILYELLTSQSFTLEYIPREINKAVHYLAQHGQHHPMLTHFSHLTDLPPLVRATVQTDSVPTLRNG